MKDQLGPNGLLQHVDRPGDVGKCLHGDHKDLRTIGDSDRVAKTQGHKELPISRLHVRATVGGGLFCAL